MKRKLLKTAFTEKLEKVIKFFLKFQKHINPKISNQPMGYPDARKTIGKS